MEVGSELKTFDITAKMPFRVVHPDMIPYSCYADPFTILTKNGELLQTFCISSYRNADNVNGKMILTARKAIAEALKADDESEKYAFWVHGVRSRNQDIAMSMHAESHEEDIFFSTINSRWTEYCNHLNYYDTVCYVTIVRQCLLMKLTLKNAPLYFNSVVLNSYVKNSVARDKEKLNEVVKSLSTSFPDYHIDRLCVQDDGQNFMSPHLKFFSRLFNFDNTPYRLPISDLSEILNKSKFHFDFGNIYASMGERKRFATILTIKDVATMTPEILTSIMNKSRDVVTCEIFHRASHHSAVGQYRNTSENMSYFVGEESIFEESSFGNFAFRVPTKEKIPGQIEEERPKEEFAPEDCYQQYFGFMLIAGSLASLNQSTIQFIQTAKEHGLVLAQEDIGIERAFYSFLPANFRFVKHANFVHGNEVCKGMFSYKFDNENIHEYVGRAPLFLLPTINEHAYAFGVPIQKSDILISTGDYRYSTVLSHLIALYYSTQKPVNIYILDTFNHASTFMKCIGGRSVIIRPEPEEQTNCIDLFYPGANYEEREARIRHVLDFIKVVANISSDAAEYEIDEIAPIIARCESTDELHEAVDAMTNKRFFVAIKDWFSTGGQFSRVIGIETDRHDVGLVEKIAYTVSDKFMRPSHVKDFIFGLVLHNIMQRVSSSQHPSLVILHSPFELCTGALVEEGLLSLVKNRRGKDVVFVFCTTNSDPVVDGCKIDTKTLLEHCDTEFHVFDATADEKYGKHYNLLQHELLAIQRLKSKSGSALLKQSGLILPVFIHFEQIKEALGLMLCDNGPFQERVKKCIEFYNNDQPNFWVKYFVDREEREEKFGKDPDDQEFVEKKVDESLVKRPETTLDEQTANEIIESA